MTNINPIIEDSWKLMLESEFNSDYFKQLKLFLVDEKKKYPIYPGGQQIFSAFNLTPFDKVKVVILGQDPYHGKGQAHGLSFSVPDGITKPPSLINIFKELHNDTGIEIHESGNLEKWAMQGILLLNAILTVRANSPGSHRNNGWEIFTDAVISKLSEKKENIIFLLWGKYAQSKENLIDTTKHYILKAAHPSPYSANSGFFGCRHFSKTNNILKQLNIEEIDWKI